MKIGIIAFYLFVGVWTLQSCRNNISASNKSDVEMIETPSLDSIKAAYLLLDKKRCDFGEISSTKKTIISMDFRVKNIGKTPLIILKADVSCGCLSVNYPRQPILPGESALLIVDIDTDNQEGAFNKTIFIKSNAENDVELLRIIGTIKK